VQDGKIAATTSARNRGTDACESLRCALQKCIADGDAGAIQTLLRGTAKGVMTALIVSITQDPSVASEICNELYVQPNTANVQENSALQTCCQGLYLMGDDQLLKAYTAFEVVANGDNENTTEHDRGVARLLHAVCAAKLDVYDGWNTPWDYSGGGRVGAALRQLLRSLNPNNNEQLSLVHGIAFLASPAAELMKPCARLAMESVSQGSTALSLHPLQPQRSREQEVTKQQKQQANKERKQVPALHDILQLTGLKPVKDRFFEVRNRIRLSVERNENTSMENHNTIFIGNPGTGKTTVARLYAQLLHQAGALAKDTFEETSGAKLLAGGVDMLKDHLARLNAGGVLFIDEVYQLNPQDDSNGALILDYLLTEVEDRRGKVVFVIAGYAKPLEKLFAHNDGLPSRFPHSFPFPDFTDEELTSVLLSMIKSHKPRFNLMDEKHVRIAARRLGLRRDTPGFGNARAVRNLWELTLSRQAARILESRCGVGPEQYNIAREDLLGRSDVRVASTAAVRELDGMIGLTAVKGTIRQLIGIMETNAEREDAEEPLQAIGLNRVLLGNPGTGKTTVAKIYGRILRDIGLLSKGEVLVRNPSDFIGQYIGGSEANTNAILNATLRCAAVDHAMRALRSARAASVA
jgi:Holliday junction resolvasome RuvABC ATP-dependent DNA helicase subunit